MNNGSASTAHGRDIVDRFPAGFSYVEGSALLDGVPTEPTVNGQELVWSRPRRRRVSGQRTLKLLLAVGAGVTEGEFVNRAQAVSAPDRPCTCPARQRATVRVIPDPTFDCTDVIGKVFDDANRNGVQDAGEAGLRRRARGDRARVWPRTPIRTGATTSPARSRRTKDRGSNFVLKLDDRTLPSGFRMSTDQVQVQRATRGKALRFNFGASIHRVVGIDLSDAVFEPGTTEMRPQWKPRIDVAARGAQEGSGDAAPVVRRRRRGRSSSSTSAWPRSRRQIIEAWEGLDGGGGYELTIEPEVFWRRGGPPAEQRHARRSWKTGESMLKHTHLPLLWALLAAPFIAQAQEASEVPPGEASERQLPSDQPFMQWVARPARSRDRGGRQAGAARGPRRAREDREAQERRSADPVRVRRGGHPGELRREAANGARRDARAQERPAAPRRPRRLPAPVGEAHRDLRRQRRASRASAPARSRSSSRRRSSFRRRRSPSSGRATPSRSPRNDTDEGRALNRRVEVEVWYDESETGPKVEDVVVPGDDQARQGLPDGEGVQAPLPGRRSAARAREEPGRAAPLRRRDGERVRRGSSARSDRRWPTCRPSRTSPSSSSASRTTPRCRVAPSGSTELRPRCRRPWRTASRWR